MIKASIVINLFQQAFCVVSALGVGETCALNKKTRVEILYLLV